MDSGVTKTFRNGEIETQVLHGIDLEIYPGEFVAIMGQSGSGKSTLMNMMTGANAYVEDKLFATLDTLIMKLR